MDLAGHATFPLYCPCDYVVYDQAVNGGGGGQAMGVAGCRPRLLELLMAWYHWTVLA